MAKFSTSKVGGSEKNRAVNYSTEKKFSFRSQKNIVERQKEIQEKKHANN